LTETSEGINVKQKLIIIISLLLAILIVSGAFGSWQKVLSIKGSITVIDPEIEENISVTGAVYSAIDADLPETDVVYSAADIDFSVTDAVYSISEVVDTVK